MSHMHSESIGLPRGARARARQDWFRSRRYDPPGPFLLVIQAIYRGSCAATRRVYGGHSGRSPARYNFELNWRKCRAARLTAGQVAACTYIAANNADIGLTRVANADSDSWLDSRSRCPPA
jgi:hypothetical protein